MMTVAKTVGKTRYLRFKLLLFFLVLYLLLNPFLAPYPSFTILAHGSLSMALFFSVYALEKSRNQRSWATAVLVPLLVLYWLGIYDILPFSRLGAYLLFVVYFGLLVYFYVVQITRIKKITSNSLYGALCLYLIIGLFWGSLYALLNEISPGSYSGSMLDNAQGDVLNVFNYFSLVTLTTLGYGDITPQTMGAGALCQIEAIIGQFFTAVVVAWFVGSIISERYENNT